MVYDDDTPRTGNFSSGDEPRRMRPPRDEHIRNLILDTVRTHPTWRRIRIYEELRDRHPDKHPYQAEVDYVLKELNNLHL